MNDRESDPNVFPKRRLRRFFSSSLLTAPGQKIILSESETHHLIRILRLKEGETCLVMDGQGHEGEAVIETLSLTQAVLDLRVLSQTAPKSGVKICFYVALPKKGKMDDMIEKAQEMGIDEIVPLETERTEIKIVKERSEAVFSRWQKIAQEAAKQSGSSSLIQIKPIMKLSTVLKDLKKEEVLFFHPSDQGIPLEKWIKKKEKKLKGTLHAFIGPEGGFSSQEVKQAELENFSIVSLGKNVLKVDTAFIGIAFALKTFLNKE